MKFKEPISVKEKIFIFSIGALGLYFALNYEGGVKYIGVFLVVINWGLIALLNVFEGNQWNHTYNPPKKYKRVLLYTNDERIISGSYNTLIDDFVADKKEEKNIIYLYWCEIPYKNLSR